MVYKKERIGKFVDLKQGFAVNAKSNHHISKVKTDLPLLRIADMRDDVYNVFVKDSIPQTFIANPDDIIYTRTGQVGLVFTNKYGIVHNNCFRVIPNNNFLNRKYLFYALQHEEVYLTANALASGSAQPDLPHDSFRKIKIYIPTLEQQDKIACILSTYDDLIERNNRKIQILQDMAEELYKEWFVRFRFSGYKTAKFTDGIPDGWEYKPFSEVVTFERGVSYSSDEIDCEDGINLINLKNINSYGGFRLDGTKKYNGKYRDGQVVKCGDLVMGITDMTQDRRTVGAVALIPHFDNTCVISADLVKLNSDIDNLFIYSLCRYGYYSKFFSQFANGSNVLHLKPSSLRNQKMLIPREDLIDSYVKVVRPINDTVNNLNRENDNLKQQRDLLLPRLMSGKLAVKVS